jgi:hypothetical protein
MNLFSARSAVIVAERRLMQAKGELRENVGRTRLALRSTLGRSTSLFIAAGVGGLVGAWVAHRTNPRVAQRPTSVSLPDWMSARLIRVGMQRLVDGWQHFRAVDPKDSPAVKPT